MHTLITIVSYLLHLCFFHPKNWSKKGAEKGRGGGGSKLPPRFAKKQQQQQASAASQQQSAAQTHQTQISSTPQSQAPQPQSSISVAQQSLPIQTPSTGTSKPLEGTVAPLLPSSVEFTTKTQAHSTLGTELWENKVAGSTVLPDVKKRKILLMCCFINVDWSLLHILC